MTWHRGDWSTTEKTPAATGVQGPLLSVFKLKFLTLFPKLHFQALIG